MALGTRNTLLPTLARIIRSRPVHVLRPRTWLPSLRPSLTNTKSNQTRCLSTTAFNIKPSHRNSQLMAQTTMSVRQFAMLSPRSPQALGSVLGLKAWCDVRAWRAMSEAKTTEAIEADSTDYRSAKPFSSIPTPGGLSFLPYVGLLLMFKPFSPYTANEISHVICALHDRLGPIFRMRFGKDWMVCTDRLEDIEIVLRTEDPVPYRNPTPLMDHYSRRSNDGIRNLTTLMVSQHFGEPGVSAHWRTIHATPHRSALRRRVIPDQSLKAYAQSPGAGEVFNNGEEWKRLRSPMNKLMNRPTSVTHYLTSQEQVAVDFADRLYQQQNSDPASLTELFFRFATESVGVICFNKRLGFLDEHHEKDGFSQKLQKSYKTSMSSIAEAVFGKRLLYLLYEDSFYRQYAEAKRITLKFTVESINEVLEEVTKKQRDGTFNAEDPNFLLSLLAEKTLNEKDVYSIIDTLMFAGSDSTACSLQLLFYALATNKSKQDTLAEELMTHLGPDGHLNASSLDKLHYLKATVKESMRLYFPIPSGVNRFLPHEAVLSGYQVPKGTSVLLSSTRTAVSERHYDQPKEFLPERWLRDEGGHRNRDISTLTYLPFSVGARNCVGRRFALQELYLATAKVLQKYEIGLKDDSPPLETIHTPFCVPKHDLHFTFMPRH